MIYRRFGRDLEWFFFMSLNYDFTVGYVTRRRMGFMNDLEGCVWGLNQNITATFAWRDWEKLWRSSVRLAGDQCIILTGFCPKYRRQLLHQPDSEACLHCTVAKSRLPLNTPREKLVKPPAPSGCGHFFSRHGDRQLPLVKWATDHCSPSSVTKSDTDHYCPVHVVTE